MYIYHMQIFLAIDVSSFSIHLQQLASYAGKGPRPKGTPKGPQRGLEGCRSQRGPKGAPIPKGSRRGPRRGPEGAPARTCGCRPAAAFEGVFKLQTNANFAVAGQIFYLLIISGPPRFFSAPLVEGGRSPRREPSVLLSVPLKKEQKKTHSLGALCPKF